MSRKLTEADILLGDQLTELIGKFWNREYEFWNGRKWKFDYFLLGYGVAIEIEGGAWTRGRHTRGKGFISDMEKYNHAALKGFKVLRFTPQQVLDGSAIAFLRTMVRLATETASRRTKTEPYDTTSSV